MSEREERAEFRERTGADAADLPELVDGAERAVRGAVGEDALGEGLERLAECDLIWRMREDAFQGDAVQMPRDFNAAVVQFFTDQLVAPKDVAPRR